MSVNYTLKHKEFPGPNPGTWDDSIIYFKGEGPKDKISKIVGAINKALVGEQLASELFVAHIQNHLSPEQDVICKICGKTISEIANEKT